MFQFKPETSPEVVEQFTHRMMALKEACIHPESNKPYVLSVKGGFDGNPPKHQYGITHAFVFEFANRDEWKYYIDSEPAHWDIAKSIKDVLEKVQTVDFEDGLFSGKLRD